MDNLTETKLTSEKIYSGCILDFYRDTVRLPNGGTAPRELSRHVGAVCIVPLLDDGRVIVERQFRYPVNEVITEIPAGKRDSRDEAPEAAARRELREETGITARELIPLGPFYPAAAYSDEVIWMYLARGLTFGEQQLDDDEFLNLQAVPLDELARDVLAGRIPDAKTQAAILRVYCMEHGFGRSCFTLRCCSRRGSSAASSSCRRTCPQCRTVPPSPARSWPWWGRRSTQRYRRGGAGR